MIFKEPHLELQFKNMPALLKLISLNFIDLSEMFGIRPVITRILDDDPNQKTLVHKEYRAIDFRDFHEGKYLYTSKQTGFLLDMINKKYTRTDQKQTLIHHDAGSGFHWHLQISSDPKVNRLNE